MEVKFLADASDRLITSVLGIVVFFTLVGATVGLVLDAFTNVSGSGIALAVLFGTILPLVFAVAVFKGGKKLLDLVGK